MSKMRLTSKKSPSFLKKRWTFFGKSPTKFWKSPTFFGKRGKFFLQRCEDDFTRWRGNHWHNEKKIALILRN